MINFLALTLLLVLLAGAFIVPTLWRQAPVGVSSTQEPPQRWTAVWLLTGVVFVTALLYAAVGQPLAIDAQPEGAVAEAATTANSEPSNAPSAPAMTPAQIEGMVARLAQRLQKEPNDPAGWRMLARSYETLERFPQAVAAYQHLLALQAPDANLLTDYAVTLGLSQSPQTLEGEPEALIDRALKLDPNHIQALALSGSVAFEAQRYDRAIAQWRRILDLIPKDVAMRASIEKNIARAQSLSKR